MKSLPSLAAQLKVSVIGFNRGIQKRAPSGHQTRASFPKVPHEVLQAIHRIWDIVEASCSRTRNREAIRVLGYASRADSRRSRCPIPVADTVLPPRLIQPRKFGAPVWLVHLWLSLCQVFLNKFVKRFAVPGAGSSSDLRVGSRFPRQTRRPRG